MRGGSVGQQMDQASKGGGWRGVARAFIAILALVVIPFTNAFTFLAASDEGFTWIVPAGFTTVCFILLVVAGRWLIRDASVRAASEEEDVIGASRLFVGLALAFVLTMIGSQLIGSSRSEVEPLPVWTGWIGTGLLVVVFAWLLLLLSAVPSSRKELARIIDLEASAMTLGLLLFLTFTYAAWKEAFGLPEFSEGIAMLGILVAYGVSKLTLLIRYR